MTYEEILKESKQLTVRERAELVSYLLNSIDYKDTNDNSDLTMVEDEYDAETIAELERRYDELASGKVNGIDANIVLAKIKNSINV